MTFDEFLAIEPCTKGKHSDIDDTPVPEKVETPDVPNGTSVNLGSLSESLPAPAPRLPAAQATPRAATPVPQPESENDDPSATVKEGMTCRRKGCGETFKGGNREGEKCVHHPGVPIFHEEAKGTAAASGECWNLTNSWPWRDARQKTDICSWARRRRRVRKKRLTQFGKSAGTA